MKEQRNTFIKKGRDTGKKCVLCKVRSNFGIEKTSMYFILQLNVTIYTMSVEVNCHCYGSLLVE